MTTATWSSPILSSVGEIMGNSPLIGLDGANWPRFGTSTVPIGTCMGPLRTSRRRHDMSARYAANCLGPDLTGNLAVVLA